jgi:hypothetical protein
MRLKRKVWSRCEQTVQDENLLWKVMEKWENASSKKAVVTSYPDNFPFQLVFLIVIPNRLQPVRNLLFAA